jgi:hypothetical protein
MSLPVPRAAKQAFARGRSLVAGFVPAERERRQQLLARRTETEQQLRALAETGTKAFPGPVLVDGTWDNPNYWYRVTLLRAALGLANGRETALLGPHSRDAVRGAVRRLGFNAVRDLTRSPLSRREAVTQAGDLLAGVREPGDLLRLDLPHGLPAAIVYDGMLKRLRQATVEPSAPGLREMLAEALQASAAASALFDDVKPEMVVLSHAINFGCGAMAWEAARRGVPAVVAYGNYGVPRFWKIRAPEDVFDSVNRPTGADLDALSPTAADWLAALGRSYLGRRLSGQTDDIGARYAYARRTGETSRAGMCAAFGWNPDLPIVAVYASNWFDFPHGCGMSSFVDYLDWLKVTLDGAKANAGVNWLFKAHPCDEWYGGITLSDLMQDRAAPHVRLAPTSWNGAAVMQAADAVVTVLGTAGLEYAALGKATLAADRGWYHDSGFCLWPRTRAEYVAALARPWWKDLDPVQTRRRAEVFAGWYFCAPEWQLGGQLADDSEQNRLYERYPSFLADNAAMIARETALVSEWWRAPHRHYHVWKMLESLA